MGKTIYGLAAFLRLANLRPNEMISGLKQRKFKEAGNGPPTSLALARAMQNVFYNFADPEIEENKFIAAISPTHRDHMKIVFGRYCRIVRHENITPVQPQLRKFSGIIQGPLSCIDVRISPEIAYHRGGNSFVVQHWTTKHTRLTANMRDIGYAFLRNQCALGGHKNSLMAVQDLAKPKFDSELQGLGMPMRDALAVLEAMERVWLGIKEDTRPMRYVEDHDLRPLA